MTRQPDEVCMFLQEIGLPAVRVKPVSAEVIGFNELFASLVDAAPPFDDRFWFSEVVLRRLAARDSSSWEAAFAKQTPVQVAVGFKSPDGQVQDFEMRSCASTGSKESSPSILCVFIPLITPTLKGVCDARFEGQELERSRIRSELHRGVSQQLLGAAFGCKILASRVALLSEDLGKEASDLANLVNEAVMELQNLVQSGRNQG